MGGTLPPFPFPDCPVCLQAELLLSSLCSVCLLFELAHGFEVFSYKLLNQCFSIPLILKSLELVSERDEVVSILI